MKKLRHIFVAAVGIFLFLSSAFATDLVPLKAFFGKPAIGAAAISPSGQFLAITVPNKDGKMELQVADLDKQPLSFKVVAWLKDYDIHSVFWVGDKRILFNAFDAQAGAWAGTTGLWAVDPDGENPKLLIDAKWAGFITNTTKSQNILSSEWFFYSTLHDGTEDILVGKGQRSSLEHSYSIGLARLNTRIPDPHMLSTGAPDGTHRFIVNQKGQPVYADSNFNKRNKIYHFSDKGEWQQIADNDDLSEKGWHPRFLLGDSLFISSQTQNANAQQLLILNPETNQPFPSPILSASGFDVGDNANPIVDDVSNELIGWRYHLDTWYTRWINPKMANLQTAIDKALPTKDNVIACRRCIDTKRLLIISSSDKHPSAYYYLETATGRMVFIGDSRPEIEEQAMGSRRFVRIKARDGEDLPIYVTRPASTPADKALPTVIYVHGGPRSRVSLEWSDIPQFLASRGYLVLEPEFRGSEGYGINHLNAGDRQWGLKMQDDLVDALEWAVNEGFADKNRVCIMGASYGGYAALMGPVHDPKTYRCAVSFVGVTDIVGLLKNDKWNYGRDNLATRSEKIMIGDLDTELDKLKQTSPVNRAADIHVPVLAAWGKDDQRVPLEQGRDFKSSAEKAGVKLEYVEYSGEGHRWLLPETYEDFFGRVEKFLSKNIEPAK